MKNPKFLLIVLSLFLPMAAFASASGFRHDEKLAEDAISVMDYMAQFNNRKPAKVGAAHCAIKEASRKAAKVGERKLPETNADSVAVVIR